MWRNIVATAVVVAAVSAAWYAFKPVESGRDVVAVIAARQDLPQGTVLAESMLETRTMPRAYLQQGAMEVRMMSDIKLPVGMSAAVPISKGDQVTQNCLVSPGKLPAPRAADNKDLSRENYLEGLKYFQNANYEKAGEKWRLAVKQDPKNADAANGLARIKAITSR